MSIFGPRAIEITDQLTASGIERLKISQILIFNNNGKRFELKISKIRNGRVWAREVRTHSQDEMVISKI